MSSHGANLPYHFRPSKFVDRQIFFDLLGRYSSWNELSEAGYISMGAYTMSDHTQIYQKLGISKLATFDFDADVVPRSHFNRPVEGCLCKNMSTGEVAGQIHSFRADLGVADKSPQIVWFDYTNSYSTNIHSEIGELISNLQAGDVVRITINAKEENYRHPKKRDRRLPDPQRQSLFEGFVEQVLTESALDGPKPDIPSIVDDPDAIHAFVKSMVIRAASDALDGRDREFVLLAAVAYRDGAPMFSLTGVIVEPALRAEMLEAIRYVDWPFALSESQPIIHLEMGQVTLREYLLLDRLAGSNVSAEIVEQQLGFNKIGELSVEEFYEKFRLFSRLYPSFLEVAT
ncbi:MAG: O-methyltransferase [Litorimonas sp.]